MKISITILINKGNASSNLFLKGLQGDMKDKRFGQKNKIQKEQKVVNEQKYMKEDQENNIKICTNKKQ